MHLLWSQREADGHDFAGELEGPLDADEGDVVVAVVLRVVAGVHHDLLGEEGGSVLVPDEIDTLQDDPQGIGPGLC